EAVVRCCAWRSGGGGGVSGARVTWGVVCTLLSFVLICLPPAIVVLPLPGAGGLELFDALPERRFQLVVPVAGGVDLFHHRGQRVGEVGVQALLEGADLGDRDVVRSEEHTSELQSREDPVCRL